jgi:hypothetical protein
LASNSNGRLKQTHNTPFDKMQLSRRGSRSRAVIIPPQTIV